jgi:hypothetical protein
MDHITILKHKKMLNNGSSLDEVSTAAGALPVFFLLCPQNWPVSAT